MKALVAAGAGLVLIVLVTGLAFGPKAVGQIKTTLLNSTPTPTPQVEGLTPSTETVFGNITLTISSPSDGSTVNSPDITVSGKTTPNADVFVNEKDVKANASGNFSVKLTLDEGDNLITVTANDEQGNYIEKEITINFVSLQ